MISGPSGFGEPRRQRFTERVRREVLVLDVDRVLLARNHVEIQRLHFADLRVVIERGARSRQRDVGHP